MNTVINDEVRVTRSPSVLSNRADDAIVMMDIDSGSYYDLEASAAIIWDLIEAPTTVGALCKELEERFRVDSLTCRSDVSLFLRDLASKGLVEIA